MNSKLSILGLMAIAIFLTVGCGRQNEPVAAQAYTIPAETATPADTATYDRVTDHRNFSEARRPVIVREVVRDQESRYREPQQREPQAGFKHHG